MSLWAPRDARNRQHPFPDTKKKTTNTFGKLTDTRISSTKDVIHVVRTQPDPLWKQTNKSTLHRLLKDPVLVSQDNIYYMQNTILNYLRDEEQTHWTQEKRQPTYNTTQTARVLEISKEEFQAAIIIIPREAKVS